MLICGELCLTELDFLTMSFTGELSIDLFFLFNSSSEVMAVKSFFVCMFHESSFTWQPECA